MSGIFWMAFLNWPQNLMMDFRPCRKSEARPLLDFKHGINELSSQALPPHMKSRPECLSVPGGYLLDGLFELAPKSHDGLSSLQKK